MTTTVTTRYRNERTLGAFGAVWGGINLPVDVSVGPSDRLFFITRGHSSMNGSPAEGTQDQIAQNQLRVNVWTFDDDKVGAFARAGWGDGELIWPSAVAVDAQERLFVTDEGRHDVQVFDQSGALLEKWGSFGVGPGQFNRPSGVALLPDGCVLVSDCLNHRIQKLGPHGEPLASWGSRGTGHGQLDQPWGLAIDGANNVYVADWGNDRVGKFSPDGEYLATFGASGSGPGELRRPASVAVDDDGDVYVADSGNKRVQIFSPDGTYRTTLAGDGHLSKHGVKYYRNFPQFWEGYTKVPALRLQERHFDRPISVKFDRHGRLLVVDSSRHRLQIFEKILPSPGLVAYFVTTWSALGLTYHTSLTDGDEARQAWLATDWLIRSYTPVWFQLARLADHARQLRELEEVTSEGAAEAAMPVVAAARDAAESAAVRTDWAAAPRAAWDAARAVAWPAVRFAPSEEIAAAARDAAGAAAWAAKPEPLTPWPADTLASARSLLDRMLSHD